MTAHVRYADLLALVADLQRKVADLTAWRDAVFEAEAAKAAAAQEKARRFAPMDRPAMRMRDIVEAVAISSGLTVTQIVGPDRTAKASHPRQRAFLLCKRAGFSTTQIGRFFGGRDHTTVLHGVAQAEKREQQ